MTATLSKTLRLGLLMSLMVPMGACTYTNFLSGADENGGTVNLVTTFTQDAALESANDHCQKYGRVARMLDNDEASNSMSFTCGPADGPQEHGRQKRPL